MPLLVIWLDLKILACAEVEGPGGPKVAGPFLFAVRGMAHVNVGLAIWVLFAEGEAAPAAPGFLQSLGPMLPTIAMMVFLWIFLISRPQKREQQVRRDMLANVKKNDRVLTTGGIYGVVTSVQADANEVTLRIDETSNTKLRMTLSSVAQVLGDPPADKDAKDAK